jgi:two-component system cell cycle response regulator DivK
MARILVVEDDEWSRRIVVDLLQMRGHDVIEAVDADSARAGLTQAPELVLLDIQFPGGNGLEILGEARTDPGLAGLPVIALTASAMSGDRERFLRQGFTAYMSKPIDVKTFGPTVESYLRGPL